MFVFLIVFMMLNAFFVWLNIQNGKAWLGALNAFAAGAASTAAIFIS